MIDWIKIDKNNLGELPLYQNVLLLLKGEIFNSEYPFIVTARVIKIIAFSKDYNSFKWLFLSGDPYEKYHVIEIGKASHYAHINLPSE